MTMDHQSTFQAAVDEIRQEFPYSNFDGDSSRFVVEYYTDNEDGDWLEYWDLARDNQRVIEILENHGIRGFRSDEDPDYDGDQWAPDFAFEFSRDEDDLRANHISYRGDPPRAAGEPHPDEAVYFPELSDTERSDRTGEVGHLIIGRRGHSLYIPPELTELYISALESKLSGGEVWRDLYDRTDVLIVEVDSGPERNIPSYSIEGGGRYGAAVVHVEDVPAIIRGLELAQENPTALSITDFTGNPNYPEQDEQEYQRSRAYLGPKRDFREILQEQRFGRIQSILDQEQSTDVDRGDPSAALTDAVNEYRNRSEGDTSIKWKGRNVGRLDRQPNYQRRRGRGRL